MDIIQALLSLLLVILGVYSGQPSPGDAVLASPGASDALPKSQQAPINPTEPPDMSQTDKVLTYIHDVSLIVMESWPMRVSLEVRGEHPDGCEFPVQVSQRRAGNSVSVEVFREIPSDVFCPMILKPYHDTIHLEGDFVSGSYTFAVNDHTQTVEL